uniref:Uncharacterized protein n=1 Tax=Leersia perrieri TaxID=77586 RepID=A0A0D9VDE0_9ORYZ
MESLVFEPHLHGGAAVAGGDVVFCVVILCLCVLSMIIFAVAPSHDGGEQRRRRRCNGPVFVGGRGCGCGGCNSGAGVCGTYLS